MKTILILMLVFCFFSCSETNIKPESQISEFLVNPNDLMVKYYDNGSIKFSQEFINGIKHGSYEHLYSNGKLQTKGFYNFGYREGVWEWFDEYGKIVLEVNYGKIMARL